MNQPGSGWSGIRGDAAQAGTPFVVFHILWHSADYRKEVADDFDRPRQCEHT